MRSQLARRLLIACAATTLVASFAPAQRSPDKEAKPKSEATIMAEIADQITSADPAQRQQAVQAIRARVHARGLSELRQWLRQMTTAKMHKEVADLALEGILSAPYDTRSVEVALTARIKALLALGQADEALVESKSLFNVATMAGTSEAILTVAECINASKPEDVQLFNRFRDEQIAGAAVEATTRPAAAVAPATARKCTVLAAIKVNPAPFEQALKGITGEDAQSLMARGNLLLMADRVKEARVIFERMYSLASAELSESSEALARCMKAEDGTIGRANAWVLSIRPRKGN